MKKDNCRKKGMPDLQTLRILDSVSQGPKLVAGQYIYSIPTNKKGYYLTTLQSGGM